MFSRDLLAERAEAKRTRAESSGGTWKKARTSNEEVPEPVDVASFDSVRASIELLEFDPCMHTTLCVDITAELGDKLVMAKNDKSCETVHACIGMYYNTGAVVDEKFVWKQISAQPNFQTMYIFSLEGGWYCASEIFEFYTDIKNRRPLISFWAKSDEDLTNGQQWPSGDVHSPYMVKWTNTGVIIKLGHGMLVEAEADLRIMKQAALAEANGATDTVVCKSKGKGGHGGWMPRAAAIAARVYVSDWIGAKAICDKFCGFSTAFSDLVWTEANKSAA